MPALRALAGQAIWRGLALGCANRSRAGGRGARRGRWGRGGARGEASRRTPDEPFAMPSPAWRGAARPLSPALPLPALALRSTGEGRQIKRPDGVGRGGAGRAGRQQGDQGRAVPGARSPQPGWRGATRRGPRLRGFGTWPAAPSSGSTGRHGVRLHWPPSSRQTSLSAASARRPAYLPTVCLTLAAGQQGRRAATQPTLPALLLCVHWTCHGACPPWAAVRIHLARL